MEIAKRNDYIQIRIVLLEPKDRKSGLPTDTAKQPLIAMVKGYLDQDQAEIGQTVMIKTPIGRELEGEFVALNPPFGHDYGAPIPELLHIGAELHAILDSYEEKESKNADKV
jgi:hypothetical protein